MKRIIILFVLLFNTLVHAQSSGITYQAVLYNPSAEILPGNNNANAVLTNKDICLRFSISNAQTILEYQETHKVKTDEFGMVNVLVGSGTQVGGFAISFNAIVWNSSVKKLQVEIDVTGNCTNFIEVSKQDFSAVPFAYASKTTENVTGIVTITNGGTGSSTVSGAKTNLGLNNVDNTSDMDKPISIATQTVLNDKENAVNKSTSTTLGTSDVLYPTQNAVKTYVDNQISLGVVDATGSVKGKIKLAGDLSGTSDLPIIANNAVTNSKIGEVISINKGGTGSNMNGTSGYIKQATLGANFSTTSVIPVADVVGAVSSVNGVLPVNGNVSVLLGRVFTGTQVNPDLAPSVINASPSRHQSDIYLVAAPNDTNNGRTFIYDGTSWNEVITNVTSMDSRYVNTLGDTMDGDLTVPAGKKITIADAPVIGTDVVNKNYADTKIGGSGTVNFLSKFNSASQIETSSIFDNGTNIGIGLINPSSKLEVVGEIKSRNTNSSNSITLNTNLATLDISSATRMFRFGSYTGATYNSLIDGAVYVAGVSGISQLSMNTPGNQPITFATNDWLERMRIQPTTGNVGIGTSNPSSRLEVNGAVTNTTALNSVAATTIDFSRSNLAYTTASAGAFVLSNIKDGGTFSLAVQGVNSGTSTFTSTGYTFRYINNGITSANKHTIYTFLVMGTTVYVYMATGF
jgi:hypothetical protein